MNDEPTDYVLQEPRLLCPLCYRPLDCTVTTDETGNNVFEVEHLQLNPNTLPADFQGPCPNIHQRWLVPMAHVGPLKTR